MNDIKCQEVCRYIRIMYMTCENTPNTVVHTKPTNVVLSVLLYKIVKMETKLHNLICIPINSFVHIFILFLYQHHF